MAQAGKFGAVTIATNMAGRGTDIMLGGNAEYLAKDRPAPGWHVSEELIAEADRLLPTPTTRRSSPPGSHSRSCWPSIRRQIAGEAEKVRDAGGLFIIGTERHESRRIDNQLRGRSGRQGDPGETRFFLSLEDDLMRLFGGERIQNLMDTLKIDEDTPIEAEDSSPAPSRAPRGKVEGRNFQHPQKRAASTTT